MRSFNDELKDCFCILWGGGRILAQSEVLRVIPVDPNRPDRLILIDNPTLAHTMPETFLSSLCMQILLFHQHCHRPYGIYEETEAQKGQ